MSGELRTMKTFSRAYWREAASQLKSVRMLAVAAMIVALRVAVKFLEIPLAAGLKLSFDCYVNAVGSLVYGPVAALCVGAVSDTVGCIVKPTGAYFFPFIFVEMMSGFIFALFFWRKKLTTGRFLTAKFSVNFVCNIIMTSVFVKWQCYLLYGIEEAAAYNLINLVRIAKSLILFPLEAALIGLLFEALTPLLARLELISPAAIPEGLDKKKMLRGTVVALLASIALILLYIFFLKDFLSAHNIKLL